jgi:hypothetical protein
MKYDFLVLSQFEYCFPQRHKMHKELSIGVIHLCSLFAVQYIRGQVRVFAGHPYFGEIDELPIL